jgi:glycosyltransferase involved in cell wall biosynthesis
MGALTFFKPFIVSAWGSDVMEFPQHGAIQRIVLRFVFWRASKICATSAILKSEINKYTPKTCLVVPFGVDLRLFYKSNSGKGDHPFTFGCIKHFERIYNIDKVVLAFGKLTDKYPLESFKLRLIGDGSQKQMVEQLVHGLALNDKVEFIGRIDHNKVPFYLNTLDAFVNVSEFESFGVAVAEAMACKVPVIVSNFEGFRDLVPGNENAIITESTSPEDIFIAMESCFLNAGRRATATLKSYELVKQKFNWTDNLRQMEMVYYELAANIPGRPAPPAEQVQAA